MKWLSGELHSSLQQSWKWKSLKIANNSNYLVNSEQKLNILKKYYLLYIPTTVYNMTTMYNYSCMYMMGQWPFCTNKMYILFWVCLFQVVCEEGQPLNPPQMLSRTIPYFTLTLHPPVILHNYLPYDLQFSLQVPYILFPLTITLQ